MRPEQAAKLLRLARLHADLFGEDPETKVGALILSPSSPGHILSSGCNAMCRGHAQIPDRWARNAKYSWVVHAEANAVASAASAGVRVEGAACVVTLFPCVSCCKLLIQAGIRTVVAPMPDLSLLRWGRDFEVALEMLTEAGVEVVYADEGLKGEPSTGPP